MHTLIMVPALGCDHRLYDEIAQGFADLVSPKTVIADCDRLEGCVGQILAEAPERFIVLGTSFGGRVALETALAAPDRIEGLIVIGASAGASPDRAAGLRRSERLRHGEAAAVMTEMADMAAHLPGPNGPKTRDLALAMMRDQGADVMARQSDALTFRSDLTAGLGRIDCPALMLWGSEDRFVAARDGLRLSTALPHARFVEIPSCGHFPTLEGPAEALDALRHWLHASHLSPRAGR